jgi:hypothetical protein
MWIEVLNNYQVADIVQKQLNTVEMIAHLKTITMNNIITVDDKLPRKFTPSELKDIKDLTTYMSNVKNVTEWNLQREHAKTVWPERIISAVDGLHKWAISYDKSTKVKTCLGLRIQ